MYDLNNSKRSIWKKIAITSIGSGASQVINFIFGIVLVRLLSVSEYSVYKQGNGSFINNLKKGEKCLPVIF